MDFPEPPGPARAGAMPNVDLPLAGGCFCGALRYQVSMPPMMVYNCHCTNCQKVSGGAFSTAVTILEAGFEFVANLRRFLTGEPLEGVVDIDAGY